MTQRTPSQYKAEIAELHQWMSDACELLHSLGAETFDARIFHDQKNDLLRRAEGNEHAD